MAESTSMTSNEGEGPADGGAGRSLRLPVAVALVSWVGALVLVASILVTGLHLVDDGVFHLSSGSEVTVSRDGLTVYASRRHDVAPCFAVDDSAPGRTELNPVPFDISGPASGITIHAIASTPDDLPAGRYAIDCDGADSSVTLWVGDRIPLRSLVLRGLALLGCFLVGPVVMLVLVVRRLRSAQRSQV